jgi:glutathione S-transferase
LAENSTLYCGNKAYSSWSLRVWLVLKSIGLDFEEVVVPLEGAGGSTERLRSTNLFAYSPVGRVPVLHHGDQVIWDSLSIIEFANEICPDAGVWPAAPQARAHARSLVADIHAGYGGIGAQVFFNIRRAPAEISPSPACQKDIDRIAAAIGHCKAAHETSGPFLFGSFGAVDAYFAPLASIFETYGLSADEQTSEYFACLLAHPLVQEWKRQAIAEPYRIDAYES